MKLSVELELQDVYGGDGIVRTEARTKTTLKRRKNVATTKDFIGVTVDDGVDQEKTEMKDEPINTFRFNEQKQPLLRLGGAHGKMWGAMKACAKQLKELGDADFSKYSTLMDMILISPVWAVLETDGAIRCEAIPQMMAGMQRSMVPQSFDVVLKANVRLELTFPDQIEKKVRKLLSQVQVGTHLNKRRSIIKVLDISEV